MEIKTKSSRMHGLIVLYDLHTTYFPRAIEGISTADASKRLDTKANHIAWLAGSLVQERFELAQIFGLELKSASHELFADHKGIQADVTYPSLDVYRQDWEKISPLLRAKLLEASDEKLDEVLNFPGMSFSIYEMVSFDTYREANCIGQIALWRRLLNYDPINYM
ncbi:MAG: DinB family protein [Pedobacter sp.]|nr:DinB family protein [Pedobacter sp.]